MQDLAPGGSLNVSSTASIVVITDSTIWRLWGRRFVDAVEGKGKRKLLVKILPPGEGTKTRAVKEDVENFMLDNRWVQWRVGIRRLCCEARGFRERAPLFHTPPEREGESRRGRGGKVHA